MNLKKFFKIIFSVGLGLITGSLLIYLINDISFDRIVAKKNIKNFSKDSNVNVHSMKNGVVSERVIKSKNNRYLKLSNYPVAKSDVKYYPSNKHVEKIKKNGESFAIDIKVKEMYDRGYTNNDYRYLSRRKVNVLNKNYKKYLYNVVNGDLILSSRKLVMLKNYTLVNGNLYIKNIDFLKLPKNLYVNGNVYVSNSRGLLINENTIINGHVIVSGVSSLRHIVSSIKIAGQVFIKS